MEFSDKVLEAGEAAWEEGAKGWQVREIANGWVTEWIVEWVPPSPITNETPFLNSQQKVYRFSSPDAANIFKRRQVLLAVLTAAFRAGKWSEV